MRRTPKNYDGTAKTSKSLSDLLPHALKDIRAKAVQPAEEIFLYWRELIGDKIGLLTEPISFLDGVLVVKVKSQALYALLCQHERPRLLRQLQNKFSVRGLTFKIG
jgi:hypothetical protein